MKKIGVALIGTGFISRFLSQGLSNTRAAEITAVQNPNEESAKRLASYIEALGMRKPKVYTDLREMLNDPAVNAPWITNPNNYRIRTAEAIVEEARQGRGNLTSVACEKPLARTADEAQRMVELVRRSGMIHGYLENQVYSPSVARGREIAWTYGAKATGRPYLARTAEEHGGPHNSWFWDPTVSGGGALLDMACHSIEAARSLLTDPGKPKSSLIPYTVTGDIRSLKWAKEPHISQLRDRYGVDYSKTPAEDYASVTIGYEDDEGNTPLSEAKTSWCYSGPGLRLSIELLGPEYSVASNSLQQELSVFLSRNVSSRQTEDFVEKQAAEQGLMPIVPDEAHAYGYAAECRHMTESFAAGRKPTEDWEDGLLVTQLMMHAYKSAEEGRTLRFDPESVRGFTPKVAKGTWRP